MIPGIEEMLLAHAKHHNLRRIDVGTMKVGNLDTFIATVWWEPIHHENPCCNGIGESVADAVGKALDAATKERVKARIAAINERPLAQYTPVATIKAGEAA